MNYTQAHTIGNTEYTFRTRLDWFSLDSVPDKQQFIVLVDADEEIEDAAEEAIASHDPRRVLMVDNRAAYGLGLLGAYLLSIDDGDPRRATPKRIKEIDPRHIPSLLQIAEEYHAAQISEIKEFEPGNPTA